MVYGTNIEGSQWNPLRSVVESPELSPSGNLILRVGRERAAGEPGYAKSEHVVLTPEETESFLIEAMRLHNGRPLEELVREARA